jgi:hypothetical protein
MIETPHSRIREGAIFADRMAAVAMSLFAVYLASVLVFIVPPRWFDPLWQLNTIKFAVDAASIPLLGLALLHLAAYLSPDGLQLQRRRETLARMAILASLGFLLMVPLQAHAVWKSYRMTTSASTRQQASATKRADAVRQAIEKASSAEDLQKRLLGLQRPDLRIDFDETPLPALPLPQLKRQLLDQLNKAEGQFKLRYAPPAPATTDRITRESLRVMASSLAFSIGFAACAQRRNSSVPLLMELPSLPGGLIGSLLPRRRRPGNGSTGLSFLKSPSQREEELLKSLAPPDEETPPTE